MKIIKLFILSLLLLSANAYSDKLTWTDEPYTHYSDEEGLKSMLEAMAASQGTPIVISDAVNDVISVYFREMKPKTILDSLVQSHHLIWYFDAGVLYVYKDNEMQRGSVTLKEITTQEFTHGLRRLGIITDDFHWDVSEVEDVVYFEGPERFVSSVLRMATVLDKKSQRKNIYQWTDKNGRVHFSGVMPKELKNGAKVDVVREYDDYVVLKPKSNR